MIGSSHLITYTLAALIGGGLLVSLAPRAKDGAASKLQLGLTTAIILYTLFAALRGLFLFNTGASAEIQFLDRAGWIPSLGVFYAVGADGLSLSLWLLTVIVTSLVVGWTIVTTRPKTSLLASILILAGAVLGCFVARDLVLFFSFFELMLFPSYVLMIAFGADSLPAANARSKMGGRERATMIFVLYTALAGALLLAGIIGIGALQATTGMPSFSFEDLSGIAPRAPLWIVCVFAAAFGIKAALVPLHGWLAVTYEKAPIQATILFAALLSKVGLYGYFRICAGIFHETFGQIQHIVFILGVVGIVYGALVAMAQPNLRRMLAYSSLSHLGFCFVGIGAGTVASLTGAALQMVNHGITIAALFMIVWALEQRSINLRFDMTRGIASRVPWLAGYFLVFVLSSVALPLTNNFVGEFLILSGAVSQNLPLAIIACLGIILVAVYMLQATQKLLHGEISNVKDGGITDLHLTEKLLFAPLVALIFFLGIRPAGALHALHGAVVALANDAPPVVDLQYVPDPALDGVPVDGNQPISDTQGIVASPPVTKGHV